MRRSAKLTPFYSIEMNVIIIAACIPTLRPLCLVLFRRPGASHYRSSRRHRGSSRHGQAGSNDLEDATQSLATIARGGFEGGIDVSSADSMKSIYDKKDVMVNEPVLVEGEEVRNADDDGENGELGPVARSR